MNVANMIKKPEANFFFSFVVGLGLAVLMFHRPQSEIEVSAIPPAQIRDMVTKVDGKCYRYRIEDASCPAAGVSL
jgi:hypothetical protein